MALDHGGSTAEIGAINRPWSVTLRALWSAVFVLPASIAQAGLLFTSLYSFTGGNDGATPNGLVQGSDGNLYGTTSGLNQVGNNSYGNGTVFKISTNGTLTTLYTFGAVTNSNGQALDGANPMAGLVQGSDGNFYGTTEWDGAGGYGTVFKITPAGALTTLYSFSGGDGALPFAGLVQGSDGNFYGTTCAMDQAGNIRGASTVFKISPTGVLTTLYYFTGGNDGAYPTAALVQGSDGNFYGTTPGFFQLASNTTYYGTVFKITADGLLTTLHSFTNGVDGGDPNGLAKGGDGNFYGTTSGGGAYGHTASFSGYGTVFEISSNGMLRSFYSFTGGNDGAWPYAGLVLGSNGTLYGAAADMGAFGGGLGNNDSGTVFGVTTNGALTPLYVFTGPDGSVPLSALVQGSDGNLYGTTASGGNGNAGTVFRISLNAVTGSLQVELSPNGAVESGAGWQVDGGPIENGGANVTLAVGQHIVSFTPVPADVIRRFMDDDGDDQCRRNYCADGRFLHPGHFRSV